MSDCPQTPQEGTFLKPEHIKVPVLPPNAHLDSDCRGVASILARVGDTWFYKQMGDAALVEKEKAAFVQFVQTVKY